MLRRLIFLATALLLSGLITILKAQNIEEKMMKAHPECNDVFMNAMDVLPDLYRERQFDSMRAAIAIWERSCGSIPQIQITNTLFSIEDTSFNTGTLDSSFIDLLNEYAERFESYRHNPQMQSPNQASFFKFASAWSSLLLKNKKLGENEKFVCRVFNGEIAKPGNELRKNGEDYPELTVLLKKRDEGERNAPRINITFTSGVWIPTGNLSFLGVKPALGVQVGARNKRHQVDLTFQIRFVNSADPYIIKRNGDSIIQNYYFGGYLGLDYNYYFVTKPKMDLGIVVGMGYDGFDVTGSSYYYDYYYSYDYMSPHTIGSFNANGGLRFNYYFNPKFYIGLQGRYNWINYGNPGGTNMNGDGISIDLIFGFNHKDNYHY